MNKKSLVLLGILLAVAVVVTVIAAGGNQPSGIIIDIDDDETIKDEQEQSAEEDILLDNSNDIEEVVTNSILGVWITEGGDIYTIDTNSEYSVYIADSETLQYGTYETDESSYITFKTNDGTETKYVVSFSTESNEYGEEFIAIHMHNENTEIKLIKQYEINETFQEQEEQIEVDEIIEE